MADPVTHVFLGAACTPTRPWLGAIFGLAADFIQLPMWLYKKKYYPSVPVGAYDVSPEWMHAIYRWMHSVVAPLVIGIISIVFCPLAGLGMVLAYFLHVAADAFFHKDMWFCYPFRDCIGWTNWWESPWTKWVPPAVSIGIFILVYRLANF